MCVFAHLKFPKKCIPNEFGFGPSTNANRTLMPMTLRDDEWYGFSRNASERQRCQANISSRYVLRLILVFWVFWCARMCKPVCGLRMIISSGHWHWMRRTLGNSYDDCRWVHQTIHVCKQRTNGEKSLNPNRTMCGVLCTHVRNTV